MTLFISPSLIITPVDTAPAWYPLLGWHNVVTFSGLAATSSAAGYPVTNLSTDSTIDRWVGGSAAELVVTLTGIDDIVDYVGIARHNLGSAGIEVSVETLAGDVGADWEEAFAGVLPADDAPMVMQFDAAPVIGVRVRMQAGTAAPDIAAMRIGKLIKMQKGLQADFVPLHRAVTRQKLAGRNERGDYLGTIITDQQAAATAAFRMLEADWYDETLAAFVLAANEGAPFFFVWDPDQHPDEVGYCWLREDAQPRFPMLNKGYLDLTLALGGVVS